MKSLFGIEGIIPATPVVYTNASCKTIDFDAVREHFRFLLDHDISALCVGGHAGETECLTMDERLKIIEELTALTTSLREVPPPSRPFLG